MLHFLWVIYARNLYFYNDNRAECTDKISYVELEKFPNIILVSVSISSKVTETLFRQTKSLAINSKIYINEFLETVYLKWINEHHNDGIYILNRFGKPINQKRRKPGWMFTYVPSTLIHQTSYKQDQSRTLRVVWNKIMLRRMFDQNRTGVRAKHFFKAVRNWLLESLMKGVKLKFKYIGQWCFFLYLKTNNCLEKHFKIKDNFYKSFSFVKYLNLYWYFLQQTSEN